MTVIGQCKLCHRSEVELQNSHLLPKAGYRLLTKSEGGDAPIVINPKISISKNEQVRAHVFCKDCEDRFNRNGERWVLKHCYRDEESFLLKDSLESTEPEIDDERLHVFAAASISSIDIDKLLYFAMSVFWRASVHRWKSGSHTLNTPSLGSKYDEQFRQYLLGKGEFPKNATLWVSVITEKQLWDSFAFPYGGKVENYWRYHFLFRGLIFTLHVGNLIPRDVRQFCLAHSPQHFVGMGAAADEMVLTHWARLQTKSKAVGALAVERVDK